MAGAETQPVVSVEPVEGQDDRLIADLYQTVLVPYFRADELETPENFAGGIRSGVTRAFVARTADGAILGGVVVDWFAASHVLLLSYIAVRSGQRSGGVGAKLMAAVTGAGTADLEPLLIVAEIDDPRHYQSDAAHGDPRARVRFYERLGGRTLPLPYMQPGLGPGESRVPNMLLMVLGGSLAPPETKKIDGAAVELFLREYFELCEGPQDPGDSQLQALLAACRQPDGLPLLLFSELTELSSP